MRAFLIVLAAVAVVGIAAADRESGLVAWWGLRADLHEARDRIEQLRARNALLRSEIQALEQDPFALERAIREDLELAKHGEVVVRFVSETGVGQP